MTQNEWTDDPHKRCRHALFERVAELKLAKAGAFMTPATPIHRSEAKEVCQ